MQLIGYDGVNTEDKMEEHAQPDTLSKARLRARRNIRNPLKNKKGAYGMYADLESVLDSVLGPCLAEGIEITQWIEQTADGKMQLQTELCLAETGEQRHWSYPILPEKPGSQGFGGAVSYARRYVLNSIFCLAIEEMDDECVTPEKNYVRPEKSVVDMTGQSNVITALEAEALENLIGDNEELRSGIKAFLKKQCKTEDFRSMTREIHTHATKRALEEIKKRKDKQNETEL